jgi:dihydrofolate reductase
MRRLIFSINMTLDGFCDHTDVIADEELHEFANELLRNTDLVLFGRVTYELFEQYWPGLAKDQSGTIAENEFARRIDDIDKIVFSKTLSNPTWKNTRVISSNIDAEIRKLKKEKGRDMLILASPGIVSYLINHHLIDEYRISLQPIVSGKGKPLFGNNGKLDLELIGTKIFGSGVVVLNYIPG